MIILVACFCARSRPLISSSIKQGQIAGIAKRIMSNGCTRNDDVLPDAPEMGGMMDEHKANTVADRIEVITQNHCLLDAGKVHHDFPAGNFETLTVSDVSDALAAMSVPRGLHGADPPRQLLVDYRCIFAVPFRHVYNAALRSGTWPKNWKEERSTLLVKRKPVMSVADYRPIVITNFFQSAWRASSAR